MRVGFVFHKDPLLPPDGIDLVRLHALTAGLRRTGWDVEILAPVREPAVSEAGVRVRPIEDMATGRYDLVKTCYHFSAELIGAFDGPVVSRLVRVVDERLPERDARWRQDLLRCQRAVASRAAMVVFDDHENERRWRAAYDTPAATLLVPTGCPAVLPAVGPDPYDRGERAVLFLGSICAPRMVAMLNALAGALRGAARIHHVGRGKLDLYGSESSAAPGAGLSPLIVPHGEVREERVWDYVRHARLGLALAPGPHLFDNGLAKIYTYLRGGLPVLSEERVATNDLLAATGGGTVFAYGDVEEAVSTARVLLDRPPRAGAEQVMDFMAHEHCWERRVDRYAAAFTALLA